MQTPTQRSTRKPTAAPFSATAAQLIKQIQAEAREQLLADLSAKDAIIVLHGFDAETKKVRASADSIRVRDSKGNLIEVFRRHQPPESWRDSPDMVGYWSADRWYGNQTMVDSNGSDWSRDIGIFVCDDFGNLVQVAK